MEPEEKTIVVLVCLLAILGIAGMATYLTLLFKLDPAAEYSVAVTTSLPSRLDYDAAALAPLPSPSPSPAVAPTTTDDYDTDYGDDGSVTVPALFYVTVHIRNPSRMSSACVSAGATAAVSCNGTAVAGGAVPQFCAGKRGESEAAAPVWGVALDGDGGAGAALVLLPPASSALRRGGAAVDVALRMPHIHAGRRYSSYVHVWTLVCGGVKVGGGLTPCTST